MSRIINCTDGASPTLLPQMWRRTALPGIALAMASCAATGVASAQEQSPGSTQPSTSPSTVAGEWIDATLVAIRDDFARPPVHARNLYHVSAAMYDAWAAFDPIARFVFLGGDALDCAIDPGERAALQSRLDVAMAQQRAVAAAADSVLRARFARSPGADTALINFDALSQRHGVDTDAASEIGRRAAACTLARARDDGANEADDYANRDYASVNPPLDPRDTGNTNLADADRWQPLSFDAFIDQSGNVAEATTFIGANWADVTPFALPLSARSSVPRDGIDRLVWLDPEAPPRSDDADAGDAWAAHHALTVQWSAHLDPRDGVMIDLSPAVRGDALDLADLVNESASTRLLVYDALDGGVPAAGIATNPATGAPYAANRVPRGDWTRVIAEYWADGPDSETPPGHWFDLYREHVATHPALVRRFAGDGPSIDPLEWDVIAHLALGGAMHDSAVAAWSAKGAYDSSRPISTVRWMAGLGQRSDASAANYHVDGLPLVPGRIETIATGDPLAGSLGRNVGRLKGFVWRGPTFVRDPDTDVAGVDWVLLENWWPYQRANFVTPPFAGYVSGHSTFSRAAATVLEALTGDAYFPGGIASFTAPTDDFLVFERGPSVDITLQWATYRDAANESGLSRIWGGIHPPFDDVPGRALGDTAGRHAWTRALDLREGRDAIPAAGGVARSGSGGCSVASGGNGPWLPLLLLASLGGIRRRRVAQFFSSAARN